MTPDLDHIILGCRDLLEGIAYVENLSGYRAAFGGSHPGRGTRNALLRIGQESYLEILAADPEQNGLDWYREYRQTQRTEPDWLGSKGCEPRESCRFLPDKSDSGHRAHGRLPNCPKRGCPSLGDTQPGQRSRWNVPVLHQMGYGASARSAPGQCLLLDFSGTDDSSEAGHARSLRAVIRGQKGPFVLGSSEEKLSLP